MAKTIHEADRDLVTDPSIAAAILEMVEAPVVVLSAEGVILSFNRGCEAITDYPAAEVIGNSVWEILVPPEEKDAVRRASMERIGAGGHGRIIGNWITRSGTRRRIRWTYQAVEDADGSVRYIVGIGADITGEAERRAVSAERGALLQSIISTSPESIVVIDERGIIRDFSPTAERMLGYGASEVIGRNVSILMPSPHRERHDGYMGHYFATGEKKIIGQIRELVAQRKDGSIFPIELMVDEVFVNDIRLFTGFIRDISQRKAAEEELRKLNTELIHAGRVAVMGEMTSAIAHEINQPLTAIANYVAACRRLLEKPGASVDSVHEIAMKAEAQVERARDIVRHFRAFVRKGQPECAQVDLNALAEEAMALALVGIHERGIATEIRPAPVLPPILVDGVQIQQVILNLVRNAIEALDDVEDRRLIIATSAHAENATVEFAVHDSGPGLAPEIKEKLFQPFMTTKEHGMGIGLSICHSIISAHGGRLWAETNEWKGTTFRFILPVAQN